jgi:outer membrane protein assembly factor BamB
MGRCLRGVRVRTAVLALAFALLGACGGGGGGGGGGSTTPPAGGGGGTSPNSDNNQSPPANNPPNQPNPPAPTPVASTHTVGGNVMGLVGSGLLLKNNGTDGIAISGDGPFGFAIAIGSGGGYAVTIAAQPTNPAQQCGVTNASGTITDANVTNVAVTCATLPPPVPPPSPTARFSPERFFAVHDEGDSRTLLASVTPGAPLAVDFFHQVSGGEQVFGPFLRGGLFNGSFILSTETLKTLPAGIHAGELTIRFCKDAQCTSQYPGSPSVLPYEVRVMSLSPNLTPLSLAPNGKDWQTRGGSVAHTGYAPITLEPAKFTRRWRWVPEDPKVRSLSDVVTYQGQAFVTTNVSPGIDPGGGFSAVGIDESTGRTTWLHPFERGSQNLGVDWMTPPTVDNGKVYGVTSWNPASTLFALNSANGAEMWRTPFATQWCRCDAPAASGDSVINHAGRNGGLAAFDAANGAMRWLKEEFGSIFDFFQTGPAATDGTTVYSVMPKSSEMDGIPVLRGFDQQSGAILYSIDTSPLPTFARMKDPSPSPVITGANSVLIGYWYTIGTITGLATYRLEKFDTQKRAVSWFVDSDSLQNAASSAFFIAELDPVVANGVVYMVNFVLNRLEARNESDGALLWTWSPPVVDQSPFRLNARMIVTDNILFAATDRFVYAVSLASRTDVWSYWNSGTLAMSANGVLYVKFGTFVDAINLR